MWKQGDNYNKTIIMLLEPFHSQAHSSQKKKEKSNKILCPEVWEKQAFDGIEFQVTDLEITLAFISP